jgi:hypothetical protein
MTAKRDTNGAELVDYDSSLSWAEIIGAGFLGATFIASIGFMIGRGLRWW